MDQPIRSAVVVLVPTAEPVVGVHRARFDAAAAWGVPAHVTVLYPFLPAAAIDQHVVQRLRAAAGTVRPFTVTFRRTAWFGEDVVWLAPEPDEPFRALTAAVAGAFPEYPPYEGAHPDAVPHLTLAHTGTPDEHRAAEASVISQLPITMDVRHLQLIQGRSEPHSWSVRAAFPLG